MGKEDDGWEASASAWISDMGELGDYARQHVLDRPMLERIRGRGFRAALDVGCGEGRFCRGLKAEGIETTGVEPTPTLREAALSRDPTGRYLDARAERLPLETETFDLVVSYLTLIDIDGIDGVSPYTGRVQVLLGDVDGNRADFAIVLLGATTVPPGDFTF